MYILQGFRHSVGTFVCGAIAGIGSKTTVLPFDLIKKRLAVSEMHINLTYIYDCTVFSQCRGEQNPIQNVCGMYTGPGEA